MSPIITKYDKDYWKKIEHFFFYIKLNMKCNDY